MPLGPIPLFIMLEIETFSQSEKFFDGHYKLLRPLSTEGGTADVWLAIDVNTIDTSLDEESGGRGRSDEGSGMLVAIKVYRPKNALDVDGEQRFRDEFKIVYECRHENLLQPTNFSIFEGTPYLVLPYCKYGSSEQLIGKSLSRDEIWKFILDVSSGLNRLHTNEPAIIHQDIKPANILIDNTRDYAITDFGISSKRGGAHGFYYDEEHSGTMAYMAPERFQENAEPISQSDIWAFGATLCEILTGRVPFGEEGGKCQMESGGQVPALNNVPADIQRLITDCLSLEPGNRPSANDIKEAALAKQYPIKSRKKLFIMAAGLIGIIAAIFVVTMMVKPAPVQEVEEIPIDSAFQKALKDLDGDDPLTVQEGFRVMDSLSNLRYIPAMYEVAFTYGWYSEPRSLKRKRILGIELCNGADMDSVMPQDEKYTSKAKTLFLDILALNDSTYANINADVAFRLASYKLNPNKENGINKNMVLNDNGEYRQTDSDTKGLEYLQQAEEWALLSNDTSLLNIIKRYRREFLK